MRSCTCINIKMYEQMSYQLVGALDRTSLRRFRRCVVLEQEVRTKDRIVRELQRQVAELEGFLERLESEIYEERSSKVRLLVGDLSDLL